MEVLIIVLLAAILLINILIVAILKKPEILMDEESNRGMMTPNGRIIVDPGKRSPVYNDDETVWMREQEDN